ncbi:endothelial cell adhesion molecule a [Hippocampus comes]|uniref:Endothelial cell adhesion molecule a n=1 Tax=Hippocampus comes TaxID=109280 RepID=A0A3Q2Y0A2_HIPCM|nr:PREDICTED: endothelial cell-selective adhesion molecule-like [Hippocampus comes]XP_019713294.1 PREDICTED: endothelial cell-selective adhesion molecule-like [Hippocampus comes]
MEVDGTSWKLTVLSLTCLWGLSGIWAEILMPQTHLDVLKGQMVILKASYNTVPGSDLSTNTIIWNLVSNNTQLIISYTKGSISVGSSQFQGRVGFTSRMPSSDVSLYINNTQESDSGRYLCQVIIPDNPGLTAELSLDVRVPPSVPKCTLSGKPVLKGNVTLSCKSSSGKPIPLYKWKRASPSSEVFFSPMLNEKTGTLKLSNLSSNMSGKYVCTASNIAGSESCFINLEISTSNKVGVIVGATVGTVVGVLCLILICVFFLKKRQRDNEDDMANEIKEDAQAPKRVSWAKSGMGSDIISKNGTLSSIASSPQHREPSHQQNHHHHHLQQYPQRAPSDTASIITATGSTAGYRPSRHQGATTPTHFSYNTTTTLPRDQLASSEANANGGSQPRPERSTQLPQAQMLPQTYSHPQLQLQATPPPPPLPSSTLTGSNIARMGGVPIMVPAQNQAGSLV